MSKRTGKIMLPLPRAHAYSSGRTNDIEKNKAKSVLVFYSNNLRFHVTGFLEKSQNLDISLKVLVGYNNSCRRSSGIT